MPLKVKRGLGLLVIALIAWLIAFPLMKASPDGDLAALAIAVLLLVAALTFLASLVGGLVLLAWGLLRD